MLMFNKFLTCNLQKPNLISEHKKYIIFEVVIMFRNLLIQFKKKFFDY